MGRPAGGGQHLRMVGLADDEGRPPLRLRLGHQLVYPRHIGTGGIHDARALFLQSPVRPHRFAVRTDDHRFPRLYLGHIVHRPRSQRLQLLYHRRVVDDAAQHDAAALGSGPFGQLHRPLHTVAKARRFRQDHFHDTPPRA